MQILSQNKEQITIENGGIYVSCFVNSNQWLFMQEPAWLAYNLMVTQRKKIDEVLQTLHEIFDFTINDSLELIHYIEKLNSIALKPVEEESFNGEALLGQEIQMNQAAFSFTCSLGGRIFKFEYDRLGYTGYLFSSLTLLKTDSDKTPEFSFVINKNETGYLLKRTNPEKCWQFKDLSFLKGRLNLEIVNTLENKSDADWMSVVHGAAVTNGRKTILFVAESGKGKSTITALLQAKGYSFVSDDMVALDKSNGFAFSVPGAISVKPGAYKILESYYSELNRSVALNIHGTGKKVKYIFPEVQNSVQKPNSEVSHIIYLEYDPKTSFFIEETDFTESLQRFNTEAWIVPHNENIVAHLKWLSKTPSYRMVYSDTPKALETCIRFLES